jgi:hypothetical protein
MGLFMWQWINSGKCGNQQINLTLDQYILLSGIIGGISGAIVGSLPPEIATAALLGMNAFGFTLSAFDMMRNGPTLCNVLGLVSSFIGGNTASSTISVPMGPVTMLLQLQWVGAQVQAVAVVQIPNVGAVVGGLSAAVFMSY